MYVLLDFLYLKEDLVFWINLVYGFLMKSYI